MILKDRFGEISSAYFRDRARPGVGRWCGCLPGWFSRHSKSRLVFSSRLFLRRFAIGQQRAVRILLVASPLHLPGGHVRRVWRLRRVRRKLVARLSEGGPPVPDGAEAPY